MQDFAALQISAMAAICLSSGCLYISVALSLVLDTAVLMPCFSILFLGWLLFPTSSTQ